MKFQVHNRCKVWLEAWPWQFYLWKFSFGNYGTSFTILGKLYTSCTLHVCGKCAFSKILCSITGSLVTFIIIHTSRAWNKDLQVYGHNVRIWSVLYGHNVCIWSVLYGHNVRIWSVLYGHNVRIWSVLYGHNVRIWSALYGHFQMLYGHFQILYCHHMNCSWLAKFHSRPPNMTVVKHTVQCKLLSTISTRNS